MTILKPAVLMIFFLVLAGAILATGLYLYWQPIQPGGPVVDRRERAGLILVAPERWER